MANGIQKDLGKVTAYSYAKAAGYTGTEAEFQQVFDEFTRNAPGLINRMDTAVARAEAAVTNIDATVQDAVDDAVEEATASAVATANQAVSDAQAAQAAAEGAVTQANNAVTQANAAVTAAQAAQSAAEDAAGSFVLDRTLTDSGAAAPADLVGDLKESISALPNYKITFQNMFDKNTMIVGYNMAYDKTGTIEGAKPNFLDPFNNYTAIKIPLHGESSVSLKQTTTTGNGMSLWGWYAVEEDMTITSAYGSRISQYIQSGYTLSNIPETAKYLLLSIAYYKNAEDQNENLMVVAGDTPKDYLPYVAPWYEISNLKANVIPEVQDQIDENTAHRQWIGKTWAQYGDSISTFAYDTGLDGGGWAVATNAYQKFANTYMRGIGGQRFAWDSAGGSVSFINANGSLHSYNANFSYDDYSGSVPSGTTKSRSSFCSWLRITLMFPASIKDNIDLIFVMGGTNDTANDTVPTWVANSTVDPEWAASDYYSDYGGDYNISTLQGGIASTIMKMKAWMPNATIVIGTPLNGRTDATGEKKPDTIPSEYQKSKQIIEAARMFGCPVIDVFGGCEINICNSDLYLLDGVHPNVNGRKLLGTYIAGELNRIMPIK